MKSSSYTDKNGRKRLSISMTEKEALRIHDDLLGRDSFESHKLRRIIFEFDISDDVMHTTEDEE